MVRREVYIFTSASIPVAWSFSSSTTAPHFFQHQHTMLVPRLQPPLRAALTSIARSAPSGTTACLNEAFAALALKPLLFVRHASHAQQGAVNKAKDGPGKRLGAKKSGGLLSFSFAPPPSLPSCSNSGQSNMSSQATSSSASAAPTGSQATTAQWDEITRSTLRNRAM